MFLMTMLGTQALMASDLYVYPAKGQSADQQSKDEYDCYQWAKRDTGFDPMAAPTASSPAPTTQQRQGGMARGALGGAAIGAIVGDSSDAGKGAAIGGLLGGMRQRRHNVEAEQQQAQWEQQESSQYANSRNNYNRAYAACLEGRGYTVK
jgi:outer membrane lipoprotein SlyB